MFVLLAKAYWELLRFELDLQRGEFSGLYQRVKKCRAVKSRARNPKPEEILRAVNLACVFYCKKVLCLQRAAATTCLLRKAGIPAQLVIGVQTLPYSAHAWTEVNGAVVNDTSYTPRIYSVLTRC